MPAQYGFLRVGSVSKEKRGGLLAALKHNKRTLPEAGHIDPKRSPLNYSLSPEATPEALNTHVNVELARYGIKPRKNAVMAVEVIFGLPESWRDRDNAAYFADCFLWLRQAMGGEILTFDVHNDEAAPHAHALILPLIDGKLQGDKIKGNVTNINNLRKSFMAQVGRVHGLETPKRLTNAQRNQLAAAVLRAYANDPVKKSIGWTLFSDSIKRDPQPHAELLGITLAQGMAHPEKTQHKPAKSKIDHINTPKRKSKTFVGIMTSKGKGSQKKETA
jgi:hypothetical protein